MIKCYNTKIYFNQQLRKSSSQLVDLSQAEPVIHKCFTKGVLKNFANFIEKYLCWRLYVAGLKTVTLLKRASNAVVFL